MALVLVLAWVSPSFAVKKDTRLLLEQLQKMEDRLTRIELKIDSIFGETTGLAKKIEIMEEKLSAVSRGQADTTENKEKLLLSLQFLKEELNELKNIVGKINDRLVAMPTASAPPTETSDDSDTPPQQNNAQTPDSIYYTAYSDYIKKNYQLAIEGFKQFIKLYPQNGLADNSLYWIGECYYSQKMYQESVDSFTDLIDNYSDGDKIPDAFLKKGYALIELGQQSEGITVLKQLISRYPLSDLAALAQQKIKAVSD